MGFKKSMLERIWLELVQPGGKKKKHVSHCLNWTAEQWKQVFFFCFF